MVETLQTGRHLDVHPRLDQLAQRGAQRPVAQGARGDDHPVGLLLRDRVGEPGIVGHPGDGELVVGLEARADEPTAVAELGLVVDQLEQLHRRLVAPHEQDLPAVCPRPTSGLDPDVEAAAAGGQNRNVSTPARATKTHQIGTPNPLASSHPRTAAMAETRKIAASSAERTVFTRAR